MTAQRVRIIEGGKLVIPALMRRELGIATGDTVLVDVEGGELRVRSLPQAVARAQAILRRHVPEGVSLAAELIADIRAAGGPAPVKAMVSEAGASVYSASAYAAHELPQLDVMLRGAVSIARRLQDPLAELVKIDPKSIGVGQYQHDVNQTGLARTLDAVVEDCVNAVGVDVNTASPALLSRIAGLNKSAHGRAP